jgi:hypothetical protein
MSYYRKSKTYYRRPLYKPAPQKENSFDIYEYLRKEFFNADNETFQLIARFYRTHYGDSAYSYMLNTYNSWKNGSVSVSTLTMGRIIECVPKFLSPEKRLYILRCEIYNFIEKAKVKLKYSDLKLTKLHFIFETLQKEIINFSENNLHWFIGKNIFPVEQVEHYLSVCKYALNERLIQSYKQTMNDLHIIADKFEAFSYEIDSATYKIDFLNLSFNVLQINTNKISYVPLESLSINIDNSFKKFGEQYILEELMKMSFYEKEGEVNASLKSKDIDVIFSHFVDLTKEKNAVTMTSKFQGDGGILILQLEFTPFKKSVESVLIALSKIFSIIVGLTLVTLIVIKFKLYWIFTGFFFVGFIFVFYLLALIPGEISKIYKSIIQIKRYGKQ